MPNFRLRGPFYTGLPAVEPLLVSTGNKKTILVKDSRSGSRMCTQMGRVRRGLETLEAKDERRARCTGDGPKNQGFRDHTIGFDEYLMMANYRWLGALHSGQGGARSVAGGSVKSMLRAIVVASCLVTVAMLTKCGGGSSQQPLRITTASLPNGTVETLYSQPIQASGGVGPFSWSVTGALPHNLALSGSATNNVAISGTPDTAAQAAAFTVKVTDAANQSATQAYTVSILLEPDTLTLAPPSLSFAPQLIGTVSGAQVETITNTGSSPVAINSIALTGTNTDYSQTNTCGSNLAPGENCPINVTVTPSQLGPSSATITITDSTVGSPHSVSLNGVALTSGLNATLSAGSLTFANQVVGTTSLAQSLTLSNYGTTTLTIVSITSTANFGETNTCSGSNLASGASCTINVTFTPSATGSVNGTLSVTDNAPGNPQTVSLSGMGVTSNDTLTGWCVIPAGGRSCYFDSDTAQCPHGQRVKRQGVTDCYGPVLVDTGRSCSIHGLRGFCAATKGGAGSGSAASGSGSHAPKSANSPQD